MKQYESYDDDQLVNAFQQQGDAKAFEEIYKRYWFKLYSWSYNQTGIKQEAEEMVQIVFERLWKNRERSCIKNIGAYLAVSLRNIFLDMKRRRALIKKYENQHTEMPAVNTTEEELNSKQIIDTVEDTLRSLPEKTQTVFRMSRYENKSVREIAGNLKHGSPPTPHTERKKWTHYFREFFILFLAVFCGFSYRIIVLPDNLIDL